MHSQQAAFENLFQASRALFTSPQEDKCEALPYSNRDSLYHRHQGQTRCSKCCIDARTVMRVPKWSDPSCLLSDQPWREPVRRPLKCAESRCRLVLTRSGSGVRADRMVLPWMGLLQILGHISAGLACRWPAQFRFESLGLSWGGQTSCVTDEVDDRSSGILKGFGSCLRSQISKFICMETSLDLTMQSATCIRV